MDARRWVVFGAAGLAAIFWLSSESAAHAAATNARDTGAPLAAAHTSLAASDTFTFTQVVSPLVIGGVGAGPVAWGDYDGDGRLDLLTTGCLNDIHCGPFTGVFRNDGASFSKAFTWTVGGGYNDAAWSDANNDGRLDFVVSTKNSQVVEVFINTGVGFRSTYTLTDLSANALAWGDYDNDGRNDLAVGAWYFGGVTPSVIVFRNTGAGFTMAYTVTTGEASSSLAWGDYDRDGRLDLLIGSEGFGGTGGVFRNTDAGFTKSFTLTALSRVDVAWGDYDRDGYLDVAVTGQDAASAPQSVIYRNAAGAGFTPVFTPTGLIHSSAAWGDYDNDGFLDLLLSGCPDTPCAPATAVLVHNEAGAGFRIVTPTLPGAAVGSAAWGDYDNDGRLDVAMTGCLDFGCTLLMSVVYRNAGTAAVTAPTAPSGLSASVNGSRATLQWSHTPANGFSYNVWVTPTAGSAYAASPLANAASGFRRVPALGNAQLGATTTLTLPDGTYAWSVQAIDAAWQGSAWAPQGTFTVGGSGCVANTNDSGAGSLRQAVLDAAPGATICFDDALRGKTITLTNPIVLSKDVTLTGTVPITLSGNNLTRIFEVPASRTATLYGLTLTRGKAPSDEGGAILNNGTLTVVSTMLTSNTARLGGAISTSGALHVSRSVFLGNSSSTGGGAISASGPVDIDRTTFYANASPVGSALLAIGGSSILHSTFSANTGGAALDYAGATTVRASVFSGNPAGNCLRSGSLYAGLSSLGYNVSSDGACGFSAVGDMNNAGGQTDAPQSNGAVPLLAGSAAIDRVTDPALCTDVDQVGQPRGAPCDAGAVEFISPPAPNLQTTVRASADRPSQGQVVTYTIVVWNNGAAAANALAVSLPMPTGVTFKGPVTASSATGATGSPPNILSGGTLAAGARLMLTVPVTVGQVVTGTEIVGIATATATGASAASGSARMVTRYTQPAEACSVVTSVNDSGPGSLREAVAMAPSGCTILFADALNGRSIVLNSAIRIGKSLTIDGEFTSPSFVPSGGALHPLASLGLLGLGPVFGLLLAGRRWRNSRGARLGSLLVSSVLLATMLSACSFSRGRIITISGASTMTERLFVLRGKDVSVRLIGLTFADGKAGAIDSGVTLEVVGSTFVRNSASDGAAIVHDYSEMNLNPYLIIRDSRFEDNTAIECGGAINASRYVSISGSRFTGNRAKMGGGYCGSVGTFGELYVNDSVFERNETSEQHGHGGAILNYGTTSIYKSSFYGNVAAIGGGVLVRKESTIVNSIFSGNRARVVGGGVVGSLESRLNIVNSTISGNHAERGGGIGIIGGLGLTLTNSIVWGNMAKIHRTYHLEVGSPVVDVRHSIFESDLPSDPAMGNVVADPAFVRSPGNGDTDYGDLHLRPGSPAIGLGRACTGEDRGGTLRMNCSAGAYEFSSTSPRSVVGAARGVAAPTTQSWTSSDGAAVLGVPDDAVTQTVQIVFSLGRTTGGDGRALGAVFIPYDGGGAALGADFSFAKALTLSLEYDPDLVTNSMEDELLPMRYDALSGQWQPFTANAVVDKVARTVTFPIVQAGEYGLFGVSAGVSAVMSAASPDGVDNLAGGALVTYTITALNTGDESVGPLGLSTTLPAGITFVGWIDADGAAISGNAITWPIASLTGHGQRRASFTAQVSSDAQYQGQQITSVAAFTDAVGVQRSTAVRVSVNGPATPVTDSVTTKPQTPVTIRPLMNDVNADGSALTISALGAPAHGAATLAGSEVIYTPTAAFEGTDAFTYTLRDGAFTANGVIQVRTAALAFVGVLKEVQGSAANGPLAAAVYSGGAVTYTLSLYNGADGEIAANVRLTDVLPAGVQFTRWITQSGAVLNGSTLTWSAASVPTDTTTTIRFVAAVRGAEGASITNVITATAANADSTTASAVVDIRAWKRVYVPLAVR